jgi:hypothetical protein
VHPKAKRRQGGQGQRAEHSGEELVPAILDVAHNDPRHAKGIPVGIENGIGNKTQLIIPLQAAVNVLIDMQATRPTLEALEIPPDVQGTK